MSDYKQKYEQWVNNDYFDTKTVEELKSIKDDEKEIEERFYKDLEFGTAGLRGIIGAGTNRLNIYTVRKATQGLANYILKQPEEAKAMGVSIAYDCRRMSPQFADEAALVLNANGIKAYVFDELRPTPELSFSVRQLKCTAGIVITASHNPKEYNGYKVYWADGGQVPYPRDEEIITEVNNVESFSQVKTMALDEAKNKGLYHVIGKEIDDLYIDVLKSYVVNQEHIDKARDLKIVYSPLHGTGNKLVMRLLKEVGFTNATIVKEQQEPDTEFSTVNYPNPEDPKTFELALKLAKEQDADIVVATDPDADRVGAAVKNEKGEYVLLTGNMTGALLTEYILSQKSQNGTLPTNGAVIKTIVTTELVRPMAEKYGVALMDVLTGFKYIGEKIKQFEQTGSHTYVFGFEESYGSLPGTYARDKDAIVATMLLCELAAYYKTRGMSMNDGIQELYEKYGYYKESVKAVSLSGIEGLAKIKAIMKELREKAPTEFAGIKVVSAGDYISKIQKNLLDGTEEEITLPKSDVLQYKLEDGSWICVRPSGTEPKIKYYIGVHGTTAKEADDKLKALTAIL